MKIRRYTTSLLFSLFIVAFIHVFAHAETIDSFERKLKLEKDIAQQIQNDLSLLVPERFFRVSVVADFETKRDLQTEQVFQKSGKKEKTELLPGFGPTSQGNATDEQNRATTYVSVDQLKTLTFYLFLSNDITEELEKIADDYFQERWTKIDPNVISLVTKHVDFAGKGFMQGASVFEWFNARNLLIFGALLILVITFLILSRMAAKRADIVNSLSREHDDIKGIETVGEDEAKEEHKKEFVEELMDDPLAARNFVRSLSHDLQSHVRACFQTAPARKLLGSWLPPREEDETIPSDEELEILHLITALREYKKMRNKQLESPFGFLIDLTPEEAQSVLEDEPLDAIAHILRHTTPEQTRMLLASMSREEQEQIVQSLEEPEPDRSKLLDVEGRVRKKYEAIAKSIALHKSSDATVIRSILDESPHARYLTETLLKKYPDREEHLKKYLFDFEQLLEQKQEVLKRVLGQVENDVLLVLFQTIPEETKEKLEKCISKERREILKEYERSIGYQSQEGDENRAKNLLVHKAREILFS